jgi:hypothetical protein
VSQSGLSRGTGPLVAVAGDAAEPSLVEAWMADGSLSNLNSVLPRSMGSGAWKYHDMIGYTSVGVGTSIVPVRFNCTPEVTLHHFRLSTDDSPVSGARREAST